MKRWRDEKMKGYCINGVVWYGRGTDMVRTWYYSISVLAQHSRCDAVKDGSQSEEWTLINMLWTYSYFSTYSAWPLAAVEERLWTLINILWTYSHFSTYSAWPLAAVEVSLHPAERLPPPAAELFGGLWEGEKDTRWGQNCYCFQC